MTPSNAAELLALWERAAPQRPAARPIALLAGGGELPVGVRNSRLFTLREKLLGPRLASLADCPHCGERIEFEFTAADVLVPQEAAPVLSGTYEGCDIRFRVPTAGDLAALSGGPGAARRLFASCLLEAWRNGAAIQAEELPGGAAAWAAARMAEADPNADVRIDLRCPGCGGNWRAEFDIASFFWAELDCWGRRLLDEVHALATAYGWREADILALSPARRGYYLERVTG